jgi:hypothetical protein
MIKRGQDDKQYNGQKRTRRQTMQWSKEDKKTNNDIQTHYTDNSRLSNTRKETKRG